MAKRITYPYFEVVCQVKIEHIFWEVFTKQLFLLFSIFFFSEFVIDILSQAEIPKPNIL